jgi:hypothetical protein
VEDASAKDIRGVLLKIALVEPAHRRTASLAFVISFINHWTSMSSLATPITGRMCLHLKIDCGPRAKCRSMGEQLFSR